MKQEPLIPAYVMRLPWQIVIRFAEKNTGKDYFKDIKDAYCDANWEIGPDEKDLIAELGITYYRPRAIKNTKLQPVCLAIHKTWYDKIHGTKKLPEKYENHIPGFQKLAAQAIKTKGVKSRLQQEVDNALRSGPKALMKLSLARVVCLFALDICDAQTGTITTPKEREQIIQILERISNSKLHSKSLPPFWSGKSKEIAEPVFPKEFQDTQWQCFERKDGTKGSKWGISVSVVTFGQAKDENFVRLYDKIDFKFQPIYQGSAELHQFASYLQIQLANNELPGKPVLYFLKVSEKPRNQTLMVGYSWKYSRTFSKYLAKTVVFRRVSDDEAKGHEIDKQSKRLIPFSWFYSDKDDELIKEDELNDGSEVDGDEELIPVDIRRFLWNRKRNRQSMPKSISTLDTNDSAGSLYWWHQKRYKSIERDTTLKKIEGEYLIYYDASVSENTIDAESVTKFDSVSANIRVDQLFINFNRDAVRYDAQYSFSEQVGKNTFLFKYHGKVLRYVHTIEIVLEQQETPVDPNKELLHGTTAEANLAYISFSYSDASIRNSTFRGTLNRLNDSQTGPISYRCLIVKKHEDDENTAFKEIPDFVIKNFVESFGRNSIS